MPVRFPVKKIRALRLSLRILAILADEPTFVQIYGYQHSLRISILMSPGGALDELEDEDEWHKNNSNS